MPADGDSNVASERPLSMRMRPDLVVRSHQYQRQPHWVVKDPVSLSYFHLLDEEYTILQMLDGRTSLSEIQRRYEERFAPRRVRASQLQSLFHKFHRNGFLVVDAANQGRQLGERRRQKQRQRWLTAGSSLLALRLPGVELVPNQGLAHRQAVLRRLALYGIDQNIEAFDETT